MKRYPIQQVVLLIALSHGLTQLDAVLPLRDQWAAATGALMHGDSHAAVTLFREFDEWYRDEPDAKAPEFRERWLRYWGLAAMEAGELDEGIEALETWLDENPSSEYFRAFIRFQLGQAYLHLKEFDRAIPHWQEFLKEHPELPECSLVRWQWADALIAQGELEQARQHLELVVSEPRLPSSGKHLAMAAMAIIDLRQGRSLEALEQLNQGNLSEVGKLWRSIIAPQMIIELLDLNETGAAIKACRWLDNPQNLITRYTRVIDAMRDRGNSARAAVWSNHWSRQVKGLDSSITGSESLPGMDILLELKLRVLRQAGDHQNRLILSGAAIISPSPAANKVRGKAYAHAINSCLMLKKWDHAEGLVQAFRENYPRNESLEDILFLQAKLNALQGNYVNAFKSLGTLLEIRPDHPSRKAWQVEGASWRFSSGDFELALEEFTHLESVCPSAWTPFLRYQRARCLQSLKRDEESIELYRNVLAENPGSPLSEQALTALLKIYLMQGNRQEFATALKIYRSDYSQGVNRDLVGMLEGSWLEASGEFQNAIQVYSRTMHGMSSIRVLAGERISMILTSMNDVSGLGRHATSWIMEDLQDDHPLPDRPLQDCMYLQSITGNAVLEGETVKLMNQKIKSGEASFSGSQFLLLLEQSWKHYREDIEGGSMEFADWISRNSQDMLASDRLEPYAIYALHEARIMDSEDRKDSADTIRINVFSVLNPQTLPEQEWFEIARTAMRYDFPQAIEITEEFIEKHDASPMVPEAIFMLAQRHAETGNREIAQRLLGRLAMDWPDSAIYPKTLLTLAIWHWESGQHDQLERILSSLMELSGLAPEMAAEALFIRASLDLANGNRKRCRLNCERIIVLYASFHEIIQQTRGILEELNNA